jgi:phenylacetic acid degradation operon negative regulatory protein
VQTGQVGAAEALVARTRVMDVWRQFPNLDPELPEDALPGGWPRRRAQAIFADAYDALGPLAEVRFQQIVGEDVPDLARHARHFTTRSVTRRAGRKAAAG